MMAAAAGTAAEEDADVAARLAVAYLRLGEACMAQPDHSYRDCLRAYEASCCCA